MTILVVVEAPGHEHFHHQKDENGCDVVLDRQNVMPVLEVEEAPEAQNDKVYNGDAAVEGQLRNLCSWELAVRVAESDDSLVLEIALKRQSSHAVVSRLDGDLLLSTCDWVVDGFGLGQVDCGGANVVPGVGVGVVG